MISTILIIITLFQPLIIQIKLFCLFGRHPCASDFAHTVLTLLDLGADPNTPFPVDYNKTTHKYAGYTTVLHWDALYSNRAGTLPALVRAGADVNAVNSWEMTPRDDAQRSEQVYGYNHACFDCGCNSRYCGSINTDVSCPEDPLQYDKYFPLVTFFGYNQTSHYLKAKGAVHAACLQHGECD